MTPCPDPDTMLYLAEHRAMRLRLRLAQYDRRHPLEDDDQRTGKTEEIEWPH